MQRGCAQAGPHGPAASRSTCPPPRHSSRGCRGCGGREGSSEGRASDQLLIHLCGCRGCRVLGSCPRAVSHPRVGHLTAPPRKPDLPRELGPAEPLWVSPSIKTQGSGPSLRHTLPAASSPVSQEVLGLWEDRARPGPQCRRRGGHPPGDRHHGRLAKINRLRASGQMGNQVFIATIANKLSISALTFRSPQRESW